jgi:hypothetical protein
MRNTHSRVIAFSFRMAEVQGQKGRDFVRRSESATCRQLTHVNYSVNILGTVAKTNPTSAFQPAAASLASLAWQPPATAANISPAAHSTNNNPTICQHPTQPAKHPQPLDQIRTSRATIRGLPHPSFSLSSSILDRPSPSGPSQGGHLSRPTRPTPSYHPHPIRGPR